MNTPALHLEGVEVSFGKHLALTGASVSVEPGKLVGIVGPNGAGKSTMIKGAMGLVSPRAGSVDLFGQPLKKVRQRVAYIPQHSTGDWSFPINVFDAVLMGTYPRLKPFSRPTAEDKDHARHCLEQVGMQDLAEQQVSELSGGQQQRVFVARALQQKADLLFLDEPFVGIDATSQARIMQVLRELTQQGATVLVVHHDLGTVADYFDEVILIKGTVLAHGPTDQVMSAENLVRAFGDELLAHHSIIATAKQVTEE